MPHMRHLLAGIGLSGALAAAALGTPASAAGRPTTVHDATVHAAGARGGVADAAFGGQATVAMGALGGRDGREMGLLTTAEAPERVVNRMYSSNWSGTAGTGLPATIDGAGGMWTVPKVKRQSAKPKYSSTWVGVDGFNPGDQDLIQTGTDQDTRSAGRLAYQAWIEILPGDSETIGDPTTDTPAPVRPGDKIVASVALAGAGIWTIYLKDKTEHWYFEQNVAYSGPGTSGEWIEEAPTVNGRQSAVADFGKVKITHTAIYTIGSGGWGWYSTAMGAGSKIWLRQKGVVRAAPSVPLPHDGSTHGQRFAITYK